MQLVEETFKAHATVVINGVLVFLALGTVLCFFLIVLPKPGEISEASKNVVFIFIVSGLVMICAGYFAAFQKFFT